MKQNIFKVLDRLQEELERLIESNDRRLDFSEKALVELQKIRQLLMQENISDCEILDLITRIFKCSEDLFLPEATRVYYEAIIDEKLSGRLKIAEELHPRMKREIDSVNHFLEELPNIAWSQNDEYAKYRHIELVGRKRWRSLMKDKKFQELAPSHNHLKIGFTTTWANIYDLEGEAKEIYERLLHKIGKEGLEEKKEELKVWFNLGVTAHYSIYIPK